VPVGAASGDKWFHTDDLITLLYIDDGDTTQWVEIVARSNTGANPYLSNLQTPTAINGDLLPQTDLAVSLGSGTKRFKNLFVGAATYEKVVSITNATGAVTHDTSNSAIWVHSSITSNFTVNFTNMLTTVNQISNFTLICLQGATGRYPSACQIDGSSVTINWLEGVPPSPIANRKEFYTFSILRTSAGTWNVFAGMTSFG
jgi:hypothetical protein